MNAVNETPRRPVNETTLMATTETVLSPRFYTTDFDAMDRINVEPVREQWDALMAEFRADPNKGHFIRTPEFDEFRLEDLPEGLRKELVEFLVSSVTAEFSGCVLYAEIKKRIKNPDVQELFAVMARDEARHAGFINDSLKDIGIGVDLGFLTRAKKYHYFRPKFIFYATYLSEKIGYARYITIFRHLEAHPEHRFHPIFKWFREWCNDEFSHGEAFALLMRTDPKLTTSFTNKLWIKFFLVAVYSTMWVRDHARKDFHAALGVDIDWYDQEVYRKTSAIARQVFPMEIDIDHKAWIPNLNRMNAAMIDMERGKRKGGLSGRVAHATASARAMLAFARLYLIPVIRSTPPANVRLEPTY